MTTAHLEQQINASQKVVSITPDRISQLETELEQLKARLQGSKGKATVKKEETQQEGSIVLTLQSNIYNTFILLYYNSARWQGMRTIDQFRVVAWMIIAMIAQLCSVGLLCGLLIHKGRHNSSGGSDISEKSLEVLAFLMPAVLGAGFIFVYDEARRPLKELINLPNRDDLKMYFIYLFIFLFWKKRSTGWQSWAGAIKLWEILFSVIGSWAYFFSLIYSTRNTLRDAQGFIDIILNLLAYVFVFGIDEWTSSMIAVREFVPQWTDDWLDVKDTAFKRLFFKRSRSFIKLFMFAVYILVLVFWFEEFYHSK
ncbi:hypothetical protein RFI_16002 [Reticulomyxa filosa]|uniref:Uncharacterized protein n=1 Tax=Reticulomyxa filosa TaxID=46433 RepID=X6N583_RETFI|nr:hypothetical protein RFI_16002 [Reticulomyxa filosa]|eukprot:ETO21201.1 hypothetical protein RFI_16002 [Reticulomyxa filosa]